jgi:hypothetical protein
MVIRANVEESKMKDLRQFFSTSTSPSPNNTNDNPLAVKVGDIIRYQIGPTRWIGVIIETNKYDYIHMAEVQWLNDGHCGTIDVGDCDVIARAQ